jgi:type I restriction enzyme S subunit
LVINPSTYYDDNGVVPIITGKNVTTNGIEISKVDKITPESNELLYKTQIHTGDIVSMRVGYPGRSSIVKPHENGYNCCSLIITRKSPTILSELLNYILNSTLGKIQVELCQGGMGQQVVNLSDWNEFIIPTTPLPEQQQIVSYLDRKTQQIDDLIQHKEKKIELLKEKRTSLINHVVTKGLDPNVEMKDSGVEWIGEIPSHWEVIPLKFIVRNLNSGTSVNSEDTPVEDSESLGILKTSCVYGDVFRPSENKKVVSEEFNRVQCPVLKNTIIISRMNTPDLVGSNGYVDCDYSNLFLPDRLWITEFFKEIQMSVKCLSYTLKSNIFRSELSSRSTGTSPSMKNITKGDFLTIKVPFQPYDEQLKIVADLDKHNEEIDDLIYLEQNKIQLLKEYRQSLISEVVTGKKRVCEEDLSVELKNELV